MKKLAFPLTCILLLLTGTLFIVNAANQQPDRAVPRLLAGTHKSIHAMPLIGDLAKWLRQRFVPATPGLMDSAPPDPEPVASREIAPAEDLETTALPGDAVARLPVPAPAPGPTTKAPPVRTPQAPALATENSWAIVATHNARLYDVAGKNRGVTSVGSMAIVKRKAKSGKMEMLVCRGLDNSTPFILARDDVLLFSGTPESMSNERRSLVTTLAALTADRSQKEHALKNRIRKDNPHAAAYAAARREYIAYWKNVKRLQALREDTEGDERMSAASKLRKLKGEDVRIGQRYEAAKRAYDAWNARHPGTAADAELERLDQALISVQAKIDALPN